jgi:hypothetical protein
VIDFVVQHFAIGEDAPLCCSKKVCRFNTLPLDRQLPCSCEGTMKELDAEIARCTFVMETRNGGLLLRFLSSLAQRTHAIRRAWVHVRLIDLPSRA